MIDIDSLISNVSRMGGYARSYLFMAEIFPPDVKTKTSPSDSRHLNVSDKMYFVSSTRLPAQVIPEITTDYQGFTYKQGGSTTFDTIDIEFKCDESHLNTRNEFLRWMYLVHDPITGKHGLPSDYFGYVNLHQLSGKGTPTCTYYLYNVWPSAVGEISLDYSSHEISTFTVTFTYQHHEVEVSEVSEKKKPSLKLPKMPTVPSVPKLPVGNAVITPLTNKIPKNPISMPKLPNIGR